MTKMMSVMDSTKMLKKLAKTPGIMFDWNTGNVLEDNTPKSKVKKMTECVRLMKELNKPEPTKKPEPVARTLPTRPKKVFVCPKKGDESEWLCDIHEDDPLQHDGEGGFYCYTCDHSRVCNGCDDVMEECEIYYIHVERSEYYCEECYNYERPDRDGQ